MSLLYKCLGFLSLAIGLIALLVPLVPTAPFVVASGYCFARSSPRLHSWLRGHTWFGPMLRRWEDKGQISRHVKTTTTVLAVLGLCGSLFFGEFPATITVLAIVLLVAALIFVWTRPEE